MLDAKDLQEIRSIIKEENAESQKETLQAASVLLETQFRTEFNLLAENQQLIIEKLERLDDMEVMDTRITALEAMVKKLNRDIAKLQKAQ